MKTTSLFLLLSALLMSQDVASFSSSHSNLFRQAKPSTAADRSFKFQPALERKRNEFPAIHPVATMPSTKLMANPGAIAGLMTGGILGGALHAIAGKKNLNACLTIFFLRNDVQTLHVELCDTCTRSFFGSFGRNDYFERKMNNFTVLHRTRSNLEFFLEFPFSARCNRTRPFGSPIAQMLWPAMV